MISGRVSAGVATETKTIEITAVLLILNWLCFFNSFNPMTYFLSGPLWRPTAFLAIKGVSRATQGMIRDEQFVNTDPRTARLKPKLLPGCEICELLAPGWIVLL